MSIKGFEINGNIEKYDYESLENKPDSTSVTITNITQSTEDGGSNIVTFSDGKNITIKNGSKGSQGIQGEKGSNGADGFSPIARVEQADEGATITITDKNATTSATVKNGNDGKDGQDGVNGLDGKDGVSVTHSWNGTTLTVTSASGTSSANLKGEKGDKGDTGASGSNGKDGTSVTVSKVTESTADGGSNVVTFSDGKTVTIKNGSKGSKGVDGKDYIITPADKQEIKNEILSSIITQEAGESESLVMSQKAVTDLVNDALGENTTIEYETVESVEEMTDTSKQYVLKETGTIWTYGEFNEEVNVNEQIFDASKVFTGHMSGVNITSSSNKIYPLPVDMSQIPNDVDVYIEIKGFYIRNTTSPYIEKIGYSPLENPVPGTDVLLSNEYADANTMRDSFVNTSNGCKLHLGYVKEEKVSNYDTIKTVLLEIPSAQTHDASTITAYLQYSYSGTVAKWYDTELTPSAGGGGGNYVELLVKVNKNTTDITEVSNRVTALETGSETLTIPTFWQNAVDVCISKIKALQIGRNSVTFPFFSDNHQNTKYAGMLIAHIMKECNIPYCFFGGDSISNGIIADEATMIAQDKAFDTMMSYVPNGRFCRAVGNHDGFWNDGTNKYTYTRDQVYDLFLREESIAQNKHFGEDGTYYYVDEIASKVRFIVMDTNGGSVDSTQIAWVQNTALNITESGWGVVFISHQPICNAYHSGIRNAADVVSAVTSTANTNNIPIIGWFSGHVHRDRIYTQLLTGGNSSKPGTPTSDLGFTQVIITSDHTGIAYDDATKHTVANDDQSHAIDFITINKFTRTVNITRLGIGEDRSYSY